MTEPTPIRKRRPKAVVAHAVGLAESVGVMAASRKTGIPESTIRRFRERPDMALLRAENAEEVALDVFAGFQVGVRRVIELLPETTDVSKVAVAAGILYDKYALMSGMATGRTEHRELLDGMDDHEREALSALLRDVAEAVPE